MLELYFISAGDGDAALIEYTGSGGPWRLLAEQGARVWYTVCFCPPGAEPGRWASVDLAIQEDGSILSPE